MNNLDKAFSFPFKDSSWVSKSVIAGVFLVLSFLGIGIFIIAGYLIQVTQRVMKNDPQPLPEWSDIGVKFVTGFKFCVAYLVYLLPVFILMIPLIALSIASEIVQGFDVVDVLAAVYTFAFILIILPYSVALTIALPIIIYRFAANEKISDALDIGTIFAIFKKHWQSTLVVSILSLGIQTLGAVGLVFFIVGVIFTIYYTYLVSAYLAGALYLEHAGKS
jgi:Protein of unknown function (DUF4013)